MTIIYGLVVVYAVIHAYTFGRWLKQTGNKVGAYGVYGLAAAVLGLYLYAMFRQD